MVFRYIVLFQRKHKTVSCSKLTCEAQEICASAGRSETTKSASFSSDVRLLLAFVLLRACA